MLIPCLWVPKLLLFLQGSQVLLESSQVLLEKGLIAADLPEAITEAVQRVGSLEFPENESALAEQVKGVLLLTHPEQVIRLIQDLVDQGQGPDLESFLSHSLSHSEHQLYALPFPESLLLPVIFERLLPGDLEISEKEALRINQKQVQETLLHIASQQGVPAALLEDLSCMIQKQLDPCSEEELLTLLQDIIQDQEEEEESQASEAGQGSVTVAGPLAFMQIADYLLDLPDSPLTPDQRLDLQLTLGRAEAKYLAMEKLGKIENLEQQKQIIAEWMTRQAPSELMQQLDHFFESMVEDPLEG
jgi:hypothetical protein